RRGARRVRVDAGGGRYADRLPARIRGQARARDDDVVQTGPAPLPLADPGARGGEPAVADDDGLAGLRVDAAGRGGRIGEDPDPPAPGGRLSCNADVTTEVDQDTAAHGGGDPGRGPVGRQRLGGRAQVQRDRRRDPDRVPFLVEFDGLPAGRGRGWCGQV